MTTEEIYKLASELTEKEIENVLGSWEIAKETESLKTFNSLLGLGDSRALALASTISEKYEDDNSEVYYNAYNN